MAIAAAVDPADLLERMLQLSDRLNGLLEKTSADSPPDLVADLRASAAQVEGLIEELEDILDAKEAAAAIEEARQLGTMPLDKFEDTLDR